MQGILVISMIRFTLIPAVVCLVSCAGPVVDERLSAGTQIGDWVNWHSTAFKLDAAGATMIFDPVGLHGAPREDDIRQGLLDLGWIESSGKLTTDKRDANFRVELIFRQLTSMGQRRTGGEADNWDLSITAGYQVDGDVLYELETGFPRGGQLISDLTAVGPF